MQINSLVLAQEGDIKSSRIFLAIQDPVKPVSLRKTHQNWKVQPLLKHTIMVIKAAIVLGKGLVMYEETIGCKWRHPDILRITYLFLSFF